MAAFSRKPGVVTTFTDVRLPVLQAQIPEGAEVEVVPLGELVGRVLIGLSEPAKSLVTRRQVMAFVARACQALPSDSVLASSGRYHGTHECLQRTISELRHWGYSPDDLDQVAGQDSMTDALAKVFRNVDAAIHRIGRGTLTDRIGQCLELELRNKPYLDRLLVVVGDERHPVAERWLRWLAEAGVEVEVLVEREGSADDGHWSGSLFQSGRQAAPGPDVRLISCADVLAEAEWAIRTCLEAIQEEVLPHRITVVVRDGDVYAPLLRAAASRLGVRLSLPTRVPLLTNGYAKFVTELLRALASRDIRLLSRLLRSSYAGMDREGRMEALEAVRDIVRDGSDSWRGLAVWADVRAARLPWLAHVLDWRSQSVSGPASLAEWLDRLRKLLGGGDLPDRVMNPRLATAERDVRALQAMERAIADHALAFEPSELPVLRLAGFAALAKALWETEDVFLPTREQGVHVVESSLQSDVCDVMIVLGLLEGVLPRRRSEDPILADEARAMLSRRFPDRDPLEDSSFIASRERREFVRLCATPTRRLILSYPQTSEDRDNIPAFYLSDVRRVLGDQVTSVDHPRSELTPPLGACAAPADAALAAALAQEPKVDPGYPVLSTVAARLALQPDFEEEGVDPLELAWALDCPFRAAARFRLNIRPPIKRDPWSRLRRLPVLASLPLQPTPEAAAQALRSALDRELLRILGELDPWEQEVLEGATVQQFSGWIEREFAARERWHIGEEDLRVGVDLDDASLDNRLPGPDKTKVRLTGKLDATSRIGPYALVRSYEMGRGAGLQLHGDDDEIDADRLMFGLWLVVNSRRAECLALEIDSTSGDRTLYVLPRPSEPLFLTSGNLRVMTLCDSKPHYLRSVMAAFREAVTRVGAGRMDASPSEACKGCQYGELCRVSSVFGETRRTVGPFDADEARG